MIYQEALNDCEILVLFFWKMFRSIGLFVSHSGACDLGR